MPSMVVPPGEHTWSMSWAGTRPSSDAASTREAEPAIACATTRTAMSLGRPCFTPARARLSMTWNSHAGEQLAKDWKTGNSFSSMTTV